MSLIYAVDDPARQQFLRRRLPDVVGRRGEHAVDELRGEPGVVEQEAAKIAVALEHVAVAEAGKAAAVEAEPTARRNAAVDAGRKLASPEHLVEREADRYAPAGAGQHDGADAGVVVKRLAHGGLTAPA